MSSEDVAALVACGASKRDGKQPAWALYSSVLFEKSWSAAMVTGDPYVMSAKYGLLSPDDRVEPYDETLKSFTTEEKIAWAEDVVAELSDHYDKVALFGGRDYVEPIKMVVDMYEIEDVYQDTGGIGEQMAVAGEIVTGVIENGE